MEAGEGFFLGMKVVELCKLIVDRGKVIVKFILANDFVSHGYSQWLHGVSVRVVERSNHLVEVVNTVFLELHFRALLKLFSFLFKYYKVSTICDSFISRRFLFFTLSFFSQYTILTLKGNILIDDWYI
jgi:hypothetical protein